MPDKCPIHVPGQVQIFSSNFEKGDDFHLTMGYVTGLEIALAIS